MIAPILTVIALYAALYAVAYVANYYQAKWQAQRDEEALIASAVEFTSTWGQADYRVDERAKIALAEAALLAERQRAIDAATEAEENAIPDRDYISVAASRISYDAANGGRPFPENPPLTRKQQDKGMFKRVEQEKFRRGILPLNEDGIVYPVESGPARG